MNISSLRDRQIQILKMLCEGDDYCTWEDISANVGVSVRTVMREINCCDAFLKSAGIRIERKPKYGIKLVGSQSNLEQLRDSFKNKRLISNSSQRLVSIKQALLRSKEPVKLYVYAKKNDVTESTVGRDLDKIQYWFLRNNLKLIRKQGVGVYLEGDESDFRKALMNLYYETLDEHTIYNLVLGEDKKRNLLSELLIFADIDVSTFTAVARISYNIQQKYKPNNPDKATVSLCLHLLICLMRIESKEYYPVDEKAFDDITNSKSFEIAAEISTLTEQALGVKLPKSEIYYIMLHLKSVTYSESDSLSEDLIEKYEKLAHTFLMLAQENALTDFDYSDEFAQKIRDHLAAAFLRIKLGLDIRNPLESEIKKGYPEVFNLAKKCVNEIENDEHVEIPDAEVAYLALYLGALISDAKKRLAFRVAICCPSGMSSAMMLSARLRSAFDNITVAHILPVSDISAISALNDIDFIISTIDLAVKDIDVIVCHPLLKDEDQKRIIEYLEKKQTPWR
ncbi:MAG: transcription antiterminator [Oscillospiraceae bacterium]|nr:transcription antiterminator [Oscillospiraceae bacterium]